jgi:hypothetical protein
MSFEKEEYGVRFFCDGPDCTTDVLIRDTFVPAKLKLERVHGWLSTKRVGSRWDDFCPTCAPAALIAQERHKKMEHERERIKARNG